MNVKMEQLNVEKVKVIHLNFIPTIGSPGSGNVHAPNNLNFCMEGMIVDHQI